MKDRATIEQDFATAHRLAAERVESAGRSADYPLIANARGMMPGGNVSGWITNDQLVSWTDDLRWIASKPRL